MARSMTHILDSLRRRWAERRFLATARAVLDTPPIVPRDDGLVLFSMIGTRVVLPYLVAVKSLHAQLGRGRVLLLDDGTLTAGDRDVLARHCGNPRIIPIGDVDTGPCPRGGTWERLLTILDLRRDNYVVQIDSDLVTVGPVPAVRDCIDANRSFTIRGEADAEILPLPVIARNHRGHGNAHVQAALEARIDELRLPGLPDPRYVRGCSGFTGFARDPGGRALAEAFSIEAQKLLGPDKWAEWGSEQVTSNFVIANAPDALLLPYDRYLNFWNEGVADDARVIHFIGTYRYHRGTYRDRASQAIAALRG